VKGGWKGEESVIWERGERNEAGRVVVSELVVFERAEEKRSLRSGEAEFDRGASRWSIGQKEVKNEQEKGEEGERDKEAKR
jgi:hypothetical protein